LDAKENEIYRSGKRNEQSGKIKKERRGERKYRETKKGKKEKNEEHILDMK
jgi:hypothetical protein